MTIFDRSGGKSNSKMMRSLVFSLFSLFEAIGFGLNFLPIETLSVFFLYIMAKKAAKKEEKRLAGVKKVQTNAQQIREYQMARARAAVEESERLAEYQAQEAANEATFTENGIRKRA